jgi:hypothetical protein
MGQPGQLPVWTGGPPSTAGLAASVARELSSHDNLAVRELAGAVLAETATGEGLAALRAMLRSSSEPTRLKAAARVLELTR